MGPIHFTAADAGAVRHQVRDLLRARNIVITEIETRVWPGGGVGVTVTFPDGRNADAGVGLNFLHERIERAIGPAPALDFPWTGPADLSTYAERYHDAAIGQLARLLAAQLARLVIEEEH